DKKSAEGIIELLASLSKDKLVIIVTHNYEQVEMYATRKITMRDGKLSEDKRFASPMLLEAQEKMRD
ncbi:ATP-binding cassette domain-containing protein, partial [Priestia megaterium]|uniref:ATP-binding cassette domain-containing protein n=1 Tax=Priestia megaterium TaxID=1404 RepID=UPI002852C8F2